MSIKNSKIVSISLIVGLVFGSLVVASPAVAAPKSTSISVSSVSDVSVSTMTATKKAKKAKKKKKKSKAQVAKEKKAKKVKANNKKRSTVMKHANAGAKKKVRYKWGGSSTKGWDCSGFVSYAYKKAGVRPPGGTRWNTKSLKKDKRFVRTNKPKVGDVVYQGNNHMGIYAGKKGKKHYIIDAANPKSKTRKTTLYQKWDKRRVSFYTLKV